MKATLSFQKTSSRIANLSFVVAMLLCLLIPQGVRAQTSLFSEGFEGGSIPTGWTTDGPGTWQVGVGDYSTSTGAGSGSYNALIKHGTTGNVTKLITPAIDLSSVASAELSFMHIERSWAGDIDQLRVYYRTSSSGTWIQLVEYTGAVSSWTQEEGIVLPNLSSTYQIAFEVTDKYGYGVGIDNVSILAGASCAKPTGLTAAVTPGNGTVATLSWIESGTATQWQISVDGNTPILVSTNPYTVTGLTAEQAHTAKVRAYCSSSDQSDWSNTVTFTPSNAYQVTVNDGTSTNGYVPIYGFYVDNYSYGQFIVPAGDLADMAYGYITKLTFYASQSSIDWGNAQFEVYMMEVDNTTLSSLTDWTTMDKVMNAGSLSVSGNQMVVTLDNHYHYMGDNLLIGFRQTVSGSYVSSTWYGISATGASMGGYGSSISQQNFLPKMTIDYLPGEAPSCPRPTSLAYSNLAARSVTLSWTNGGDESSWIVEYATNSDFTGAQTVTANSNPYTLSGLSGETHYYVRVKAVCGGNPSDESSPVNFTTLPTCLAPTNLTATPNAQSATLTWESSTGSFSVAHATSSSANPDDNIVATVSTTTHTLNSLTLDQDHYVWVRANCGGEDGNSSWTGPVSFHIGYCTPAPTSVDNNGISNVTFGTGDNVVNNTTPKATYADYHTLVGAVQVGIEATIDITYATSYTYNTYVWVDFDNSLSFEADEIICYGESTNSNPTTLSLSFTLPVTQATGDYLMRIGGADSGMGSLSSANPCYSSSFGVFQDYTLRVLPAPSCMPVTSLAYSNLAARSVTLSWTNGGDESSWVVEYATNSDFTGAQTVNATTNPYTLTSLTPETHYWFRVKAVCGNDLSDPSNVVDVTTAISCPAPTGLATSNATATSMTLAWTDNATNAQNYQVQYGTLGTTTLLNATFESGSIDELGTITNDATYPWTVVTDAPEGFNGTYCIKSTNSGVSSSTSSFSMTVTLDNDGTISFRGGCWGEGTSTYYDKCIFSIDGTQMFSYGALQTWSNYSFALTAGTHVLAWSYSKDSSVDPTGDAFYVDDIVISTTTLNAIGTVTANSNPYTLQGLEPGTTYTAQVRNFCGYTQDDYSLWTDAVTFTTLPAAPSNLTISDVSYTSALLSWTPGGNETVWFYQLGTDDPIIVTGTNSLFFSNLEPSTTYSVKLRSRIGENLYSEWTAPVEFTTLTCNTPTGLTINNVTSSGVNFSWTPGSSETNWQYMLNSNPAASVVSNQIFVSELDAATTYTVKVRAQCANNVFSDWTDPVEFTTLPSQAACAAPTGFNATVCGNDATLRWTPGGSETNWMVQYTATGDYANATTVTLDHPYLPLTGLTSGTTYYAHVKAVCGDDNASSWVSTQFTVAGSSCHTMYDGTATNGFVPVYGFYADAYLKSEVVYPSSALAELTGQAINSMTFYATQTSVSWESANFEVFVKEVDDASISAFSGDDGATVVYTGALSINDGEMTIPFNTNYVYNGGNLLVGVYSTETGSYVTSTWYGETVSDASVQGYSYSDLGSVSPSQRNFIPKTTFCAIAMSSCMDPTNLTASDVSTTGVTLSWTAGGSEQTWIYKVGADGAEQEVTNNTITLTDLTAATTYTVYVCAKCSNTDYSCWTSVEFNTEACDPADQCVINYSFEDQYNDSWNGASIDVVDALSEVELAHITMPSVQGPYTGSFSVCPGRDILFIWNSGSYDSECSYEFYDRNGYEIFSGSGAMSEAVSHTVNCTEVTCDVPTALAASDITYTGATLSWTAGGTETVWQYSLNDEDPVDVTTNTVSFNDLTPATTYTFKVRAKCNNFNSSEWTEAVEFSTLTCSAPTGLELSTVATTSATIAWNGGTATAWQYRLNGGTPVDVTENPYTITGLDAETGYTVEVRTNCADGVYSAWTDAEEFTTLPSQLPCDVPADLSATVCENDATLRWTASGTETSWTVQYGTNDDFSGATSATVEQPNFNITGLTSGNTYYARVKAVCGEDSESGWSNTQISVAGPACHTAGEGGTATNTYLPSYIFYNYSLTEQLYTPEEVGVIGSIQSLSFYAVNTMTRNFDIYLVQTTKSSFTGSSDWINVTTVNRVFSGNVTMAANDWTEITLTTPFEYDGTSNLAVIVDDNTGSYVSSVGFYVYDATNQAIRIYSDGTNYNPSVASTYSGTVMAVKNQIRFCKAPAAPTCLVPENLAASNVAARTATLSWTAGGSEQTWVYKLGADGAEQEVTTNTITLTDLTPETDYTVYLCAKCSSTDYSCWTSTTFTTTPTCPAPTGLTASNVTSVRATLSWLPGGSESSWTLQYGTAADFSNYTEVEVTSTSQTLTHLEAETPYYARVRANCGTDDISAWSATFEFTASECHVAGSGTATNTYLPTYILYNYSLTQQIYTPQEVGGTGAIKSISFYTLSAWTRTVDVYLVQTSKSSFASSTDWISVTTANRVFTGSLTATANDWTTITLSTPFEYDGTSNLAFIVDDNTGSWTSSVNAYVFDAPSMALRVYSDETDYNPSAPSSYSGTVMDVKNQLKFCFDAPLTCATPTNVAVNDVTFNGATASWTATEGAVSYDLRYRTTPDVSLFEDFESGLGSWTNVDADGDGYAWELRTNNGTDAQGNAYYFDVQCATSASWRSDVGALTPDNWLISPLVDLQGTLSLWLRGQDPSYPAENFEIRLSTTGNSIGDFTTILIPETSATAEMTEYTADLSSYMGQQGYIAIRHFNITDMFFLNLDNVSIFSGEYGEWVEVNNLTGTSYTLENLEALTNYEVQVLANCEDDDMSNWSSAVSFTTLDVPCSAPTFLTASDFTLHGGTLSWTAGEITADGWEYTIDDGANWLSNWATTPVQNGTTVTATIDGLEAGQSYEVRVRAICGEFHSRPSNAATVTPTCYPATDLTLDEESITTTSAGLTWTSGSNAGSFQMRYATEQTPIGWLQYDNATYATTLTTDEEQTWMWGVMYPADMVEGFYLTKVRLYETVNNTGNITINIYNGGALAPATLLYTEEVIPLGNGWHEISLENPVAVDPEQNLWITLTETGTNVINLCTNNTTNNTWLYYQGTWNHISFPYGTNYSTNYSVYGHTISAYMEDVNWITVDDIASASYTLEGLEPATHYVAQVQSDCGGGDYSTWSNPVEFSTLATCHVPSALTVGTVGVHTAELSWTASEDNETSWMIQYAVNGDWTNAQTVEVSGSPATTLSGLAPTTIYKARVKSICDANNQSEWTTSVTFTTIECATPTDLEATNITHNSANIGWEGNEFAAEYEIMFGAVPPASGATFTYDFENGSIGSSFTNNSDYPWTVTTSSQNNGHSGTYCIMSTNSGVASSTSSISTTVNFQSDGTVSFRGGCWGEGTSTYWDHCDFYIDNDRQLYQGALDTWDTYTYNVTAGSHTFTWSYTKDGSVNPTGDVFYVDDIVFSYMASVNVDYTTVTSQTDSYSFTGLDPETTYTVQVRTNCGDGDYSEWSEPYEFTTLETCPAPTNLLVSSITYSGASLSWNHSMYHYNYQYIVVPTGENPDWSQAEVTTQRIVTLSDLDDYTTYDVYVRSYCANTDEYSNEISTTFSTPERCAHPDQLTVDNVTMRSATLSWNERGTATQWTLQYATDENFTQELQTITVTEEPTYTLRCLTSGTTYYARVLANCEGDDVVSRYSNVVDFTPQGITYEDAEITVYDGTVTNGYVPVYGFYADAYLKSEFVIPSSELGNLETISSMKFYSSTTSASWGDANFQVFLKEVGSATISDFSGSSNGTIVYQGSLSISGGQMTVNFTSPYTYNGGNLLVGVYNTVEGSYVSCSWYGQTVTGASVQGYSYSGLSSISASQRNFIPKTTLVGTAAVQGVTSIAGAIVSGEFESCQSASPITIESEEDGDVEFYNWYRDGQLIDNDNAHGATYTVTTEEMLSLTPEQTYTYIRKALDECANNAEEVSEGSYSITLHASVVYDESLITNNSPIYCGNDGVLAAPHDDTWQHLWYTDPECTNLYYTGDVVTIRQMSVSDTLWHKAQPVNMVMTPRQTQVYIFQEGCESASMPAGWTTSGNGNEWTVAMGGENDDEYLDAHTGTYNFWVDADGTGEWSNLLSPRIDLSNVTNATLSFWYINPEDYYWGDVNRMVAQYRVGTGSWTNIVNTGTTPHDDWTHVTYTLPGGQSNYQLRFRQNDNYGYPVCIDDIEIYTTTTVYDTTYSAVGCPSIAEAYVLQVNEHPQPSALDTVATFCGVPTTLAVNAMESEDFFYQWSTNEDFTDTVALGTEATVISTELGNHSYFVRSYTQSDESISVQYLLQEGFDNGMPSGWTNLDADGDGFIWVSSTSPYDYHNSGVDLSGQGHNSSNGYAISGSFSNAYSSILYPDNWLITPALSIPEGVDEANLSFWLQAQDESYYSEHYGLYISTTGTTPSDFTQVYQETLTSAAARPSWLQKTADLTSYAGQTVYVAIRHFNCSDEFLLNLDDFEVSYQLTNYETGCTSPAKEVVLKVQPASAAEVTNEPIICGTSTTLTLNVPDEVADYYEYTWYGSATSSVALYTGTEYTTPALYNDNTSYYVQGHLIGSDECASERIPVTVVLKPILQPVINNNQPFSLTCGTPLTLSVSNSLGDMSGFTYIWYDEPNAVSEAEIARTPGNDASLLLHDYDNTEDRTIYVLACKFNEYEQQRCVSTMDTVVVNIVPIDPVDGCDIYYTYEYSEEHDAWDPVDNVCLGDELELQIYGQTPYYDENNEPIENFTVWYRRHVGVNTDSVRYGYTPETQDQDIYIFNGLADTVGTWEYYAYAATHLISAEGEGTLSTSLENTYNLGCVTFEVTAPLAIELDTISLIPNQENATVQVSYSYHAGTDLYNDAAWTFNGNYAITKDGDNPVPIQLTTPIGLSARDTVWIRLKSAENLLFEPLDEKSLLARDNRRVRLTSGYSFTYSTTQQQSSQTSTNLQDAKFLGSIHYNLSGGLNFACMSEESCEKVLVVDLPSTAPALTVTKGSESDADFDVREDGYHVCKTASGLVLTATTNVFGDHAEYVWLQKAINDEEFSEIEDYELLTDEEESNTTVSIFVEVPDTTTIFAVSIHSLCCGETDTSMVKMYVSETPAVADIFDGATDTVLCAPYYIASNYGNPEIDNDGDWILSRGWEISIDGEDFADWDPQQALTTEHNDYYIRYRATTKCLSGYSNTTHIIVDTVPYYAESLVEPYAICGGNTFDWDANSVEAVYTNNSEFEIRTGYNLYAGGQLTEITADFVFTYHADEPDYYQYNCYTINYCDSVVSNLVTIPVWASPDIVNQLPTPVQDCAGKKIGDYFAEFEDHPDYEDNGNTIFHGWEIAPMVGSNDFTVLSDGVDIMDEDVIVNYEMNGKIVRYYVDNECGRIATLPVVLNVTDHPYVGELAEIDPVCDGTPFEMDEPEITDDGGIYRYKAGWYFVNPETMELTDTVNIGDPMTLDDWNGKYLIFGATNTCGTGFSNPIQITVNVLPAPQITVSRNDVEVSGTEFCLGPNYSLTVSTTDPNELYLWSDDLGTDNIADLGRLEEGEYSYSVVASNETTGCSGSASIEFTISAITFDTTVTVCEGGLPYTFDEQMQAVFEDAGEYTVNYTTAEGCDSVVNITLNVNRPRFERTVVHLCNGQSYEWPVNGQTYGGSSAEETVLTDTVILSALSLHDDVTGNLCDSIIYTLRVSISNSIYLELPQGDEFTVAVGEQVTMEANVRGGCSDDNAKTSVAYQLFKDDEAVASVSQYGQVNISTYLPVLHTSFGRDLVSGQGEIPGSTFAVNSYQYNYFYSNFFREVDNRITATLDEPGDYRLQMVIVRMATRSGQDFPMTYRYDTNEDPVLMGGANATPTDTVFSDTVNIYFHVDGDLVVEEPEEPTTTNSADLVLDQNDITAAVGETNMVNITALGDGDFKVGVDYEILRNGEPLSTLGMYGSVRFEIEYPGVSTFGANVNNGSGSILNSTFSVWSYQYDYFYMYFCNNLPTKMTASWNVPGEYVVRFRLNERTGGQDLPLTSNNRVIGGHGSSVYALLDMDSVVFHVDAETVQYDIEETICESNLPYVFNGHEYTESGNYTFADEFDIYDTVLNLTLHVVTTDTVEFTDDACGVYEWNGVEYTESGDYTQTFTSASTGCDSVTILHLTIINEPVIRISASNMICESEEGVLPVSAEVIYEEGFNNETTVSFAQAETSRDTVEGLVTVRYAAQLTQLHSDVVITVTSVNSVSDNSACTATDTVIVTVIPADTIADFTAAICQGELYEMMGEGWDNGFSINTANVELENMEPMVIYDTIVTGTSMCGTYRAALALTVNPVFVGDNAVAYNDEVCEGYDYEGYGFSLTAEEINAVLHPRSETADNVLTFTNNGTSSTGCDSVTVLTLTVNPTIYESFETSVCSAPYYWNNEPYEESGEYFQTFTAANGCDSVVIMTLTINEPTTGDTTATACYSFDWYEYTNITESGDYVHVFTEGDVNGCDSTVTLHLEVLQPVAEVEEVVACGSYEWNGTLYEEVGTHTYTYEYTTNEGCTVVDTLHLTINPVYNDVTDAAEITSAQLPYEWNGVTFTAAGTQVATLQTVNGCDSIVTMTLTLTDVEGSDAFMTVSMNEAGDSATVIAFANQTDLSDQVSIDYQLYKNGTLVEDVDYECGGRLYIGTEFQNHLYGAVLTEAEGNIPGNTFHISNYHYEYFYWAFLNGRASTVTHSFTEEGEYTVVLQLVAEEGGTYFPMPYDDDYTHRIGGKNSLPGATLGQPVQITFTVGANSGDDTPQTVPGPTMTITGPANGTVADTMTFASNGFDNEKVAIRYTIYDANDEPLSMLSSYGSVRIATAYNSTYYGDNLSAVTGFIPEASFHPVNRNYNYFYAGFLATTHNTITANWTVPGTYKITFELVQMTGGLDQQLTYGTEFKKLGGRNATVADVIYDTKTITYTSGNATAQNPAATGIDDNTDNADGFVIYPNPARDRAMLMLGQVSEEAFIIVTDINGKEVHRADITDTRVEFNVSTWAEGVYFVTLRDKDQIVTKKLVVTK